MGFKELLLMQAGIFFKKLLAILENINSMDIFLRFFILLTLSLHTLAVTGTNHLTILIVAIALADVLNSNSGGAIVKNKCVGPVWVLMKKNGAVRMLKPHQKIGFIHKIEGIATPFNQGCVFKVPDGVAVRILKNGDIKVSSLMAKLTYRMALDKPRWHDTSLLLKHPHFKPLFEKSINFEGKMKIQNDAYSILSDIKSKILRASFLSMLREFLVSLFRYIFRFDYMIRAMLIVFSVFLLSFVSGNENFKYLIFPALLDFLYHLYGGSVLKNNYNGTVWVLIKNSTEIKQMQAYEITENRNRIEGIATPYLPGNVFRLADGCTVSIEKDGRIKIVSLYTILLQKCSRLKSGWYSTSLLKKYPYFEPLFEKSHTFTTEQ